MKFIHELIRIVSLNPFSKYSIIRSAARCAVAYKSDLFVFQKHFVRDTLRNEATEIRCDTRC